MICSKISSFKCKSTSRLQLFTSSNFVKIVTLMDFRLKGGNSPRKQGFKKLFIVFLKCTRFNLIPKHSHLTNFMPLNAIKILKIFTLKDHLHSNVMIKQRWKHSWTLMFSHFVCYNNKIILIFMENFQLQRPTLQ